MNAPTAWTCAAAALLLACAAGVGGNAIGLAVLAVATLAPLGHRELRRDSRLTLIFVVVVLAHAGVALVNGLVDITPGADVDAVSFQTDATRFAAAYAISPDITPEVSGYASLLGYVYHATGPSLLLGSALSVLAFALAALVLIEIMRELELARRPSTLALFGLIPSGIMLLSVPLREAYQQLLLYLAVLATLRMRRLGWRWLVPMLLAATVLSASHTGLELYAGFLVISGMTWAAPRTRGGRSRRLAGLVLAAALVVAGISRLPNASGTVEAVTSGQAFEFADTYRMFGAQAVGRTTYGLRLDPSSPLAFAASMPVVILEYMLAPFPWQVANVLDLDAFVESMLRLALIVASLLAWRRARGRARSQLGLLLWLSFGMELLWAMGTVNWGTAIRHHLPTLGLFAVVGGPLLLDGISAGVARLIPLRRAV
jgi:hypothetical protein